MAIKKHFATGFLPYEIGDLITLHGIKLVYEIADIRMIQYIVSGHVEFEVLLLWDDKEPFWISAKRIEKRIIKP